MTSRAASSNNWRSSRTHSPPTEETREGATTRAPRLTTTDAHLGLIAFLDFKMIPKDSKFWDWNVNDGANFHPVTIVVLSDDNTTVTCLQITSFAKQTIQDKLPDDNNPRRRLYLAMQHDNTIPHSADPVLQMTTCQKMPKQSYIYLDNFFTIEIGNLVRFADGKKSLTKASASVTQQRLADFIRGKIPINRNSAIRSSIADLTYKPEDLNLPTSPATTVATSTLPARKTLRRSFDQAFEPSKSSTETVERPIKAARQPLAPRMGAFQSSPKMHKMEQPWHRMAAAVT